jgi:hypothetical protein
MNTENFGTLTQQAAHSKTSDRYAFIPTSKALTVFADHGYHPSKIVEARTRIHENKGFQKHIIRLRKPELTTRSEFPEIILINSHMGSCSFRVLAGYFRCVCINGLISGDTTSDFRIRHSGYTDNAVSTAIQSITEQLPEIETTVEGMKLVTLTPEETLAYNTAAIELKWDGKTYVDPSQLNYARRYDDRTPTLWNTFNRAQEHLIKSGVRAKNTNGQRRRSKAVTSVDENVRLNRALWTLSQEMLKIKSQ